MLSIPFLPGRPQSDIPCSRLLSFFAFAHLGWHAGYLGWSGVEFFQDLPRVFSPSILAIAATCSRSFTALPPATIGAISPSNIASGAHFGMLHVTTPDGNREPNDHKDKECPEGIRENISNNELCAFPALIAIQCGVLAVHYLLRASWDEQV
jgi:hypothetical protein